MKGVVEVYKERIRKFLTGLLVLCMVFALNGFADVSAAKKVAATEVSITNTVSVMTVGQSANFNCKLTPSNSTDKVTWTTSNASIAKPDAKGKFTAKKAGTVTITATATSGVKASVKVLVVSKKGVTSLQSRIDQMLDANNVKNVTIKNLKTEETYTIKEGIYGKKTLTVNAPLSEVVNNGKFKSIVIEDVKNGTFIENASGNKLVVKDKDAAVEVAEGAYLYSIDVQAQDGSLNIINNGRILKVNLNETGTVNVSGSGQVTNLVANDDAKVTVAEGAKVNKVTVATGAKNVNFTVNGKVENIVVNEPTNLVLTGKAQRVQVTFTDKAVGSTLETSVPTSVTTTSKVGVTFNEGAEGSSVAITSKNTVVDVTNKTTGEIPVDNDGEASKVETTVTPSVTPTPGTGGNGGGGVVIVPTTTTVSGTEVDGKVSFKLPTVFSTVSAAKVNVTVAGLSGEYNLTSDTLNYVKKLLEADATTIANWKKTTNRTIEKDDYTVKVSGDADSTIKTVEFGGVSCTVDVQGTNAADTSIVVTKGSRSYVLTKSADNTTLFISSSTTAPSTIINMVTFTVTY